MADKKNIKDQLIVQLDEVLDSRIFESQSALEATRESRDSETKSSMGDKYETAREMMQFEMGKFQDQLAKALKLKKALAQINTLKGYQKVEFGSLVFTNHGKYLISVGLGVVEMDGEKYFAISLASPIGKVLEGKSTGDMATFQNRTIEIVDIL